MKMEPAPGVPAYGIVVEKDIDVPMRAARASKPMCSGRMIPAPSPPS